MKPPALDQTSLIPHKLVPCMIDAEVQVVEEARAAKQVKDTAEKAAFRWLFQNRAGIVVQSVELGFKGKAEADLIPDQSKRSTRDCLANFACHMQASFLRGI